MGFSLQDLFERLCLYFVPRCSEQFDFENTNLTKLNGARMILSEAKPLLNRVLIDLTPGDGNDLQILKLSRNENTLLEIHFYFFLVFAIFSFQQHSSHQ